MSGVFFSAPSVHGVKRIVVNRKEKYPEMIELVFEAADDGPSERITVWGLRPPSLAMDDSFTPATQEEADSYAAAVDRFVANKAPTAPTEETDERSPV